MDRSPINQLLSDTFLPELIDLCVCVKYTQYGGATQQKNVQCVYQAEDTISQILQYSFLLIELGRGRKLVWFYPSRDWPLLRSPLR